MIKKLKNILLYFSSGSLLKITNDQIRKESPHLFQNYSHSLKKLVASDKSYKLIFLSISISIILCFVKYYFNIFGDLDIIKIDIEIAKSLIEKRIGNLATIIGISLAISVFMLNNISKELRKYHKIVFQETFIYPTVYFSFITLFFLLTFSILTNNINPIFFCDLVLLFNFIIILVIISIALLFSRLIKVFDPNYLKNIGLRNLLISATQNRILYAVQIKVSKEIYQKKLKEYVSFTDEMKIMHGNNLISYPENTNKYVKDIHISKLIKLLRKISLNKSVIGYSISINKDLNNKVDLFEIDNLSSKYQEELKICIQISDSDNSLSEFDLWRNYLIEDLSLSIKDKNEKEFDSNLSNLTTIYNTYFEYTLENHLTSIKYPLEKLDYDVFDIAKIKEISNLHIEKFLLFFKKIILYSYINNSRECFSNYISFGNYLYFYWYTNTEIKTTIFDHWTGILSNFYECHLYQNFGKKIDNDNFIEAYFTGYAHYLFLILNKADLENFENAYNFVFLTPHHPSKRYVQHILIALKASLYYKRTKELEEFTPDITLKFNKILCINNCPVEAGDYVDLIEKINKNLEYLGILNCQFNGDQRRFDKMLIQCMLIDLLNGRFSIDDIKKCDSTYSDKIIHRIGGLKFNDWKLFLSIPEDEESFNDRKEDLMRAFQNDTKL